MVNWGGIACRKLLHTHIYIIYRHQRPIWVSLMWMLEKYNDITLKRGIASLGRPHRLPCVNQCPCFERFPSISINQCPSNTYLVLLGFLLWLIYKQVNCNRTEKQTFFWLVYFPNTSCWIHHPNCINMHIHVNKVARTKQPRSSRMRLTMYN